MSVHLVVRILAVTQPLFYFCTYSFLKVNVFESLIPISGTANIKTITIIGIVNKKIITAAN